MANAKYEKVQTEQDTHAENDDIDEFDRSHIDFEDNPSLAYECQKQKSFPSSANGIMLSPYSVVALILIYFGFSICLTFYQRNLLRVSVQLCYASAIELVIQKTDLFISCLFFFFFCLRRTSIFHL